MRIFLAAAACAVAVSACSSTIQTTSGADYLSRVNDVSFATPEDNEAFIAAASVEPLLSFPARIGIARIEAGRLADIPGGELAVWEQALTEQITALGEIVPVNLFVTDLVAPTKPRDHDADRSVLRRQAIDRLRLGAARQHLDAVLVYEAHALTGVKNSALAIADLTLIGAYLAPGRKVNATGAASALLFDVRNGYPYASVTVSTQAEDHAAALSVNAKRADLAEQVKTDATAKLASELVRETFPQLVAELVPPEPDTLANR